MAYVLNRLKLMLVEDDLAMRALLRDVLKAFGVGEVEMAPDGASAMRLLRDDPVDIVIADWEMEPMNGLDFLKQVRRSTEVVNPFVPIIMLTAYSEMSRILACRDAGITEFMAKPVTPKRLYNRIVSVIEDRRCFVRTTDFFGPDRRRTTRSFNGPDRRTPESVTYLD
jgi:two-component system chemotaxis response regulator CheY